MLSFCSQFDGLILELAHCKVIIPPLILVILFLRALHSRYSDIVKQFRTWHKPIKSTSINMIVDDITYHHKFILKKARCRDKSQNQPSQIPVATVAHTNNTKTVWSSPFDWLCNHTEIRASRLDGRRLWGGLDLYLPNLQLDRTKTRPKGLWFAKGFQLENDLRCPCHHSYGTATPFECPGWGVCCRWGAGGFGQQSSHI